MSGKAGVSGHREPVTASAPHPNATLRSVDDLVAAGLVPANERAALERVAARYAIAITPDVARLIDASDPHDPIARQYVPQPQEIVVRREERIDPIGDEAHSPVKGSGVAA